MRSVFGLWEFEAWRDISFRVERVVLNAFANERGFADGYLRLRRLLLPSSSEKPIHLWLRLARETRVPPQL
jgi:hypothetical protein